MPRPKKSPFAQLVKWAMEADIVEITKGVEMISVICDQRFPKGKQSTKPRAKKVDLAVASDVVR